MIDFDGLIPPSDMTRRAPDSESGVALLWCNLQPFCNHSYQILTNPRQRKQQTNLVFSMAYADGTRLARMPVFAPKAGASANSATTAFRCYFNIKKRRAFCGFCAYISREAVGFNYSPPRFLLRRSIGAY